MFDVKSLFRHANFRLSGKWPRAFAFGKSLKERIKDTTENGEESMSVDALQNYKNYHVLKVIGATKLELQK